MPAERLEVGEQRRPPQDLRSALMVAELDRGPRAIDLGLRRRLPAQALDLSLNRPDRRLAVLRLVLGRHRHDPDVPERLDRGPDAVDQAGLLLDRLAEARRS